MEESRSSDLALLVERVDKLERRNRRLWATLIGLAGVTLASLSAGAKAASGPPRISEAAWFVLKASDTEVRGELVVDPVEGGKLRLYGSDGGLTLELPARQQVLPLAAPCRTRSD